MIDVVGLLRDLVAIPSMNPMGSGNSGPEYSEGALADFISSLLSKNRIDFEKLEVMPGRFNLSGFVDAGAQKTIMLEAHLDTVPADNMHIEPFDPVFENGRIYGRGSCDAKSSLAVFLGTIVNVLHRRSDLKYNVLFLGTCDEEHGFSGARKAASLGLKADFGIVGEPTRLRIVGSHKGVVRWRMKTLGKAAHSAYPELGNNAIYSMAKVVERLADYAAELRDAEPHRILGAPSMSVGLIRGGNTINIVPDSCWIEIDRRTLPGESNESILDPIRSSIADIPGVEFEKPYLSAPAVDVDPDSEIMKMLSAASNRVIGSAISEGVNYATDAGVFNQAGLPTLVFGPGDIANAHTAREFVDVSDVSSASKIIESLLLN